MFSQSGLYLLKNNPVSSAWLFICYLNQNSCLQLMKMAEILLQLKWIFQFAPATHVSKPGWNLAVFIYKKRLWLWIWPWTNSDVSRCKALLVITKIWNSKLHNCEVWNHLNWWENLRTPKLHKCPRKTSENGQEPIWWNPRQGIAFLSLLRGLKTWAGSSQCCTRSPLSPQGFLHWCL